MTACAKRPNRSATSSTFNRDNKRSARAVWLCVALAAVLGYAATLTYDFLWALLAYAAWRDTGRRWTYGLSLASFFLALMAKEVAATLPAVLLLYDWAARDGVASPRAVGRAVLRCSGHLRIMALYAGIRLVALGRIVDAEASAWGSLLTRLLTTLDIVATYVRLTVIPYPANSYPLIVPLVFPGSPRFWLGMALLAVGLGLTAWAAWRSRVLGFGALWFWVTLI